MNELQPINKTIQGKSDIEAYARAEISAALEEGEIPVLELRRQAVMLSELSKRLIADDTLREACIAELEKYGSREDVTLCGARVRIGETGVSYDYAPCGDPVKNRENAAVFYCGSVRRKFFIFVRYPVNEKNQCDRSFVVS